jgi:tetratricopeptide (TPR) repeat protein
MDSLLGRADEALARLEAVLPRLRVMASSQSLNLRWRAEMLRAALLASLGQLDEARRQRDAVAAQIEAWEAQRRRPRGEIHDVALQALDLSIAFHADTPERLPDDQILHDWARAALLRNQFGGMLVYLAWAFDRRGDADMARHLLSEAPARMPRSSLAAEAPRLQAWADDRQERWGLDQRPIW